MTDTQTLFYDDNYKQSCHAQVVGITPTGLVLDQTVFYPRGGGQAGDTGHLGDIEVTDTTRENGAIVHHVHDPSLAEQDQSVEAQIDWSRRYSLMRHHTLLHIVFLAFKELYGDAPVRGSEVRPEKARVDFEFFGPVEGDKLQQRVAEIVSSNLSVTTEPVPGTIGERLWSMPGFETIPCGGTHVRSTAEIGDFSIKAKKKGKQGIRIYAEAEQLAG